jgi:molecular chaperone GrpE
MGTQDIKQEEPVTDTAAQTTDCRCSEDCCCHENGNDECNCECECECHCKEDDCACRNAEQQPAPKALSVEEKLAEVQDKHLRLVAEFDNFRKRNARERLDMIMFAGEDIIKGLLPIVDDFERALKAAETATDVVVLQEGEKLIYQKLLDYLKSKGLQEIDTTQVEFNTDLHDAVTKFPVALPEQKGKIIDTVQKGYKLSDKVIRFAKVVVGE